jgi:hypothetical protein
MALTWQNVSPSNPAGILQAGNMAGASIAKGLDVLGSSMQEGAKNYTDAETGKLLLMLDNAKDRNERQTILGNTDMDYIDQDVIAKDNQQFEAREQQQQNILFNQGIQTAAAEDRRREVKAREADRERTFEQTKEQYALVNARADAERKKNDARTLIEAQREKTEFDQRQTAFTKKQQLDKAGKKLVATTNPLIDKTNEISELIKIREELKNRKIEDNPKADALINKANTKIGSIVNISNLFPLKSGVPPVTMAIEGTTQAAKNRSHNNNLQKTIDKLSVYLPSSTPSDLKSMAETILRKSAPGYGKAMNALKIPSEDLNNALAFKLKSELQGLKQSEGGLTLDKLQGYRYRLNLLEVNKDTATGIEKSRKRLNEEYAKVFARTPLTDIISDESLNDYMTLGSAGFYKEGGVADKRAVKRRHKSNIQNIIKLIPAADRNKLSYEEIQQKVSNSLTRQPGYADVLDAAGVDYTADAADRASKISLEWALKRTTINDQSSVKDINNLFYWADKNDVPEEELTELRGRLDRKLDKDVNFIDTKINPGIYSVIDDPSGKVDASGKPVKIEMYNKGEYEVWREATERSIDNAYKNATKPAIQKVLDRIIAKHPNIVRVKTVYDDRLAFETLYKTENDLNTVQNKIKDTNFARLFEKNPAAALSGYDLTVQMTKDIIKDADVDDKTDTFRDSIKFSRYVHDLLKKKYSTISSLQLGERAKRVMENLPPRQEWFGDDYTRDRRGIGPGLWMYSDGDIFDAAGN